jgi:phage-related protein
VSKSLFPKNTYNGIFDLVRPTDLKEKPIHWVGSAKQDLLSLPRPVVADIGYILGAVQQGVTPSNCKPWRGEGAGVFEVVEDFQGNTFRAVYTVRFAAAIYVLHCFQKKSPSGIRTARADIDTVHRRLKLAQSDYEVRYGKTK